MCVCVNMCKYIYEKTSVQCLQDQTKSAMQTIRSETVLQHIFHFRIVYYVLSRFIFQPPEDSCRDVRPHVLCFSKNQSHQDSCQQ